MNTTPSFLVIQAFGSDKPGALESLSKACAQTGCQILDSRWVVLGDTFSFGALLRGQWACVAKLEASLPKLEKKLNSSIVTRRTDCPPRQSKALPYSVEVISAERPGVLQEVTSFFGLP
jgi:glycine cleavage system transcriptional repressor